MIRNTNLFFYSYIFDLKNLFCRILSSNISLTFATICCPAKVSERVNLLFVQKKKNFILKKKLAKERREKRMQFSGVISVLFVCFLLLVNTASAHNSSLAVKYDARRVIDLGVFGYGGGGDGKLIFTLKNFYLHEIEEYSSVDEKIGFTLDLVKTALYARQERNYAISEAGKDEGVEESNVCFVDDPSVATRSRYLIPLEKKLATIMKNYKAPAETDKKDAAPTKSDEEGSDENDVPVRGSRGKRSKAKKSSKSKDLENYLQSAVKNMVATVTIPALEPGLYALFFYNCKKANKNKDPVHVTFRATMSQYNTDPDTGEAQYLSIGDQHLPLMNMIFFILFFAGFVLWHRVVFNSPPEISRNVRGIHFLMYILILLKCMSLLLNAVMLWRRKQTGKMGGSWDYLFYFFQTLKGVALFTVIVLLGTGWSFLKPFLSERDKKILLLLLPLQVIVNIAIAVLDETSEGNSGWARWKNMLHIFDVCCCCAVLLPIVWSIKTLKDAAETDGRARRNLQRLKQFRGFYIAVVGFIYFTRILITFIDNSLPYQHTWLSQFLYEGTALMFYAYTGLKFQPRAPSEEDGEDGDEGKAMKGEDVEEIDLDEREEADEGSEEVEVEEEKPKPLPPPPPPPKAKKTTKKVTKKMTTNFAGDKEGTTIVIDRD